MSRPDKSQKVGDYEMTVKGNKTKRAVYRTGDGFVFSTGKKLTEAQKRLFKKQQEASGTRSRVRPEPKKKAAPKKAGAKKRSVPKRSRKRPAAKKGGKRSATRQGPRSRRLSQNKRAVARRQAAYKRLQKDGKVNASAALARWEAHLADPKMTMRKARFDVTHREPVDRIATMDKPLYAKWYKYPGRYDLKGFDMPNPRGQKVRYGSKRRTYGVNPNAAKGLGFKAPAKKREGPTLKQLQAEAKRLGIRLSYAKDTKTHKKGSTKNKAQLKREIAKAKK